MQRWRDAVKQACSAACIVAFAMALCVLVPCVLVAADAYEPDDTIGNASWASTDGTSYAHAIDVPGDADWHAFNLSSRERLIVETQNQSPATDTVLALYATDGTTKLVEQDDDLRDETTMNSRIVFEAPADGTYYAKTVEYDPSVAGRDYTITFTKQGFLVPSLQDPGARNITHNALFNVTTEVLCSGGPCGTVTAALDPKVDKRVTEALARGDMVPVMIARNGVIEEIMLGTPSRATSHDAVSPASRALLQTAALEIADATLASLTDDPSITAIEYDARATIFLDASVPFINASAVWALDVNGSWQTVCVIDTGIDYTHPSFGGNATFPNAKVIGGYDFVNNDTDPMDDHGHGTHVAGIVASEDATYRGVAPAARLVGLKVLDAAGGGEFSDVIKGIDWCVGNKTVYNISVIVMSLGDPDFVTNQRCDRLLVAAAVARARDAGIFVAVASGNDYRGYDDISGLSTPACAPAATSVGAIEETDVIAAFTNRDIILDLLAPGVAIDAPWTGGGIVTESGTSMAAPHVAGLAALLQQKYHDEYGRAADPSTLELLMKTRGAPVLDTYRSKLSFPRIEALSTVEDKGVLLTTPSRPFWTPDENPATCTLGEGENCTTTWTVRTNVTANGSYEFFTIYENEFWNNRTPSFTVTVLANGAPNITSVPDLSLELGSSFRYDPVVTDAENDTIAYSLLLSPPGASIAANGTITWTASTLGLANVTLLVEDGWDGNDTQEFAINVSDTAAPSLAVLSPTNGTWYSNATVAFSFSADDAASFSCNASFTNATNVSLLSPAENTTLIASDGENTLVVVCNDTSGNMNTTTITFFADFTAPVANLSSTNRTQRHGVPAVFNASSSTDTRGIATYEWDAGAAAIVDYSDGTGVAATYNYSLPGEYVVTLRATDDDGRTSLDTVTLFVIRDTDDDGILDAYPNGTAIDACPLVANATNDPAACAGDADADGAPDGTDYLDGNVSQILTTEEGLLLTIDGVTNATGAPGDVTVVFAVNGTTLLSFSTTLSNVTPLRPREIAYWRTGDTVIVRGVNSTNKTVTLVKTDAGHNTVCILDEEMLVATMLSDDCGGANEFIVTCPGANATYSCEDTGATLVVSGLSHSGLREYTATPADEEVVVGGRGGGGGGAPVTNVTRNASVLLETCLRPGGSASFSENGTKRLVRLASFSATSAVFTLPANMTVVLGETNRITPSSVLRLLRTTTYTACIRVEKDVVVSEVPTDAEPLSVSENRSTIDDTVPVLAPPPPEETLPEEMLKSATAPVPGNQDAARSNPLLPFFFVLLFLIGFCAGFLLGWRRTRVAHRRPWSGGRS